MESSFHGVLLPLSAAQQELWLAQELVGENTGNNIAELITISGYLDEEQFARAVQHLFLEVDSLRVRFVRQGGDVFQWIDPSITLNYEVVDLSLDANARRAIQEWVSRDLRQAINLTSSKLHKTVLFKIASRKFAWYVRSHHAIMDGFGAMLLVRRVEDLYTALIEGRQP
jgi:hypothetical protein